jgi:hypothetical protein
MLHCEGGAPVFDNGVIMSNLQQAELVLYEIAASKSESAEKNLTRIS